MAQPSTDSIGYDHEQEMKDNFGEGFWDLPEGERFRRAVTRIMGQKVERITKEEAAEFNANQRRES